MAIHPRCRSFLALLSIALLPAAGCKSSSRNTENDPVRLGFFPNITHAQALVGNMDGSLARSLGEVKLQALKFNAGPAAMEALSSGSLDFCYVGTGPAINAYIKGDRQLRVIAGAVNGGALLVAKTARSPQELKGKTVASPQYGNSQDIALRHWLKTQGLSFADNSKGDVNVAPLANADIFSLFISGKLEAAWVPEPWGAKLIAEAGAHILVDERDLWPNRTFPTTLLVTTQRFLQTRPAQVRAILRTHLELSRQWRDAPAAFAAKVNEAFGQLTGKKLPAPVLQDAFSRIEPAVRPLPEALALAAQHAHEVGFLPTPDIAGMVDTSVLEEVLRSANLGQKN
ncbi:MAG TPA: ABC transporter substrate-binding protein [Myxococcaceae bacterium]|nr:ABC transporter substrate-binding protein [Myxococcaceae bacterium]